MNPRWRQTQLHQCCFLPLLRDEYDIQVICITEPFDETPAGKLNANMLAAIGQFYSDQLSARTQEGTRRRVDSGLFPGHAPYQPVEEVTILRCDPNHHERITPE